MIPGLKISNIWRSVRQMFSRLSFGKNNTKGSSVDTREQGKVKFFNSLKGFGFITRKNANDIFFHINEVDGHEELQADAKVEFEIGSSKKGPVAVKIKKVS